MKNINFKVHGYYTDYEYIINENILNNIKNSKHSNPDPNRIPTPDFDIQNVLESSEIVSPLQNLLYNLFTFDLIIFLLLLILFYMIFIRNIYSHTSKNINNFINKYLPINISNKITKILGNSQNNYNNFLIILYILIGILTILIILFKIVLDYHLYLNIDKYIEVHEYLHSKKV